MDLKQTASMLWARRRTEYREPDAEPPPEWRDAPRPSGASPGRPGTDGIEVVEEPAAIATVIETHYRVRCECGRRWWAFDLEPTTCPRCQRWVAVQHGD
jgi:hypothetical protein